MELDYTFYALLETVAVVQALTLGALLVVLDQKKYKSTLFLGLCLLAYGLGNIPNILESLNFYSIHPELLLLPVDFFWFYFPLFYLYTQHVCIYSDHRKEFWVLYPGIIAFFLQLAVFFLPYETKLQITESLGYDVYNYVKICYGLGIGIYTLRLLYRHRIEVYNNFSMVKSKELTWAQLFLLYSIFAAIVYMILVRTAPESVYAKIFFVVVDLTFIYWVSYHGVLQRDILPLLNIGGMKARETDKVTESTKKMENLMGKINAHMVTSESFTNTELTIVDLAETLKIHPKRISAAINTTQNQNFNAYINSLRVKKAETLLKSEEMDSLSIAGIGSTVGFHSKSAFYSAFKKETGTTPLKYKENVAA